MKTTQTLLCVFAAIASVTAMAQQPAEGTATPPPAPVVTETPAQPPIKPPTTTVRKPGAAFMGWQLANTIPAPVGCTAVEIARPHFDGKTRMVFRIDTPTGCKLNIQKADANGMWATETLIPLHQEENTTLLAGKLLPNEPLDQLFTASQMIYWNKTGYKTVRRGQEVPWYLVSINKNGIILPMAAYPGGLWKAIAIKPTKQGGDWLSFSSAGQVRLLDLQSATKNTDAIWAVNPISMAEINETKLIAQGLPVLQARLNARFGGDGPMLFIRPNPEGNVLVLSQQSNDPEGNMMMLWQSEPFPGEIKQIRLIRNGENKDGLLLLITQPTGTVAQVWVPTYEL
ncbi:MAG: hypothetical protein ACYC1M_03315 [Armatimonadota bacterium]